MRVFSSSLESIAVTAFIDPPSPKDILGGSLLLDSPLKPHSRVARFGTLQGRVRETVRK